MTKNFSAVRLAHKVVNRLRREVRDAVAFAHARMFDTRPDADDVRNAWHRHPPPADLSSCVEEWLSSRPSVGTDDAVPATEVASAVQQAERVLAGDISVYGEPCRLQLPEAWRRDPWSRRIWPAEVHFTRFKVFHPSCDGRTDIRFLWEIGRFGWALPLARAFAATGRADLARAWATFAEGFIQNNPPEFGPHWLNAMEVAIRGIQWCRALTLFFSREASLPSEWKSEKSVLAALLPSLLAHGRYIRSHLEWTSWGRTNHYIADLVGLLALGVFVPQFREAKEWKKFAVEHLASEIHVQTDADGFHAEASTAYHHFVLELYRLAAAIDRRHCVGLPPAFYERLHYMNEVDQILRGAEDRDPQIGDDDSGTLEIADCGSTSLTTLSDSRMGGLRIGDLNLGGSYALHHAGLYILRCPEFSCHVVCGPNGQQGVGGHAHNDKLSVVIRLRGKPVIIDAGTSCYSADLARRDRFRSTALHNTVGVDGEEQNALRDWRKLHDRTHARCTAWRDTPSETFFSGTHRGYHHLGVAHRRTIQLDKRHRRLVVADELEGRGVHGYDFHLHFAPGLTRKDIQLENGRVRLPGSELIFPEDLPFELIDTVCAPVYGQQIPNLCLHLHVRAHERWTFPWEFRPA
jgi:hypothetical protein